MNALISMALYYKSLGLSIIAVQNNKRSVNFWKGYQRKVITDFGIERDFNDPRTSGIAIVCGKISGNLEVLDIEGKYDETLYERFKTTLLKYNPGLFSKLVIASTKNNGYHLFYRCCEIDKHTILAKRSSSAQELSSNSKSKAKTLIERLGESTYVVVYPSPGYQFIQGSIEIIPDIQIEERDELLKIAKTFHQIKKAESCKRTYSYQDLPELSPFHDYDNRGDFIELLQHHGWTLVKTIGVKTYFRRPGDTDHDTTGDYHHELGLFTVFSPNCEFTPGVGYRPHAIYAKLECNNDFICAAKNLLKMGYGVAYKDRY